MFKERLLTALILAPLTVLAIFYLPPIFFALLTAAITLYAAWEWTFLMKVKALSMRLLFLLTIVLLGIAAFYVPLRLLFVIAFFWWSVVFIFVLLYPKATKWWYRYPIQRAIAGCLVLVPCWVSINFIRNQSDGIYKLLFLLVLIWGADISAYLVGKQWGRTKLAPHISPGKTWIGLIGALFFTIFYALFSTWFFHMPWRLWQLGAELAFLTVLYSVIGDLFESMMKRQADVKDSSQLLPGHGGLLDRIDSLTAAAPTFAMLSIWFARIAK